VIGPLLTQKVHDTPRAGAQTVLIVDGVLAVKT
jgi:hypothetical protein